ncbi:MAG: hypothetical protein CMM07_03880 [Rhodopirellula sp.]|nr:hypothetical protein [Rhodopirellula sp.]
MGCPVQCSAIFFDKPAALAELADKSCPHQRMQQLHQRLASDRMNAQDAFSAETKPQPTRHLNANTLLSISLWHGSATPHLSPPQKIRSNTAGEKKRVFSNSKSHVQIASKSSGS